MERALGAVLTAARAAAAARRAPRAAPRPRGLSGPIFSGEAGCPRPQAGDRQAADQQSAATARNTKSLASLDVPRRLGLGAPADPRLAATQSPRSTQLPGPLPLLAPCLAPPPRFRSQCACALAACRLAVRLRSCLESPGVWGEGGTDCNVYVKSNHKRITRMLFCYLVVGFQTVAGNSAPMLSWFPCEKGNKVVMSRFVVWSDVVLGAVLQYVWKLNLLN